jgi:hypothetical protein
MMTVIYVLIQGEYVAQFLMCIFVNCICLVCIVVILCVFVILCVYCCFTLDAGLLARSQYP